MADFNYAELCLAMDHLYGLKDIHHIDSFDALLYQLGLREMMKSTSAADAAVFVISAVLGDGSVSALNPMTGAMATAVYNVDLNLDHQYGQEDQGLTTKNVCCLTSPVSFSCGNLVPCVFKNSNQVTIIGRTSGGGSCVVLPMSSACGTGFQISGFTRLAFIKNGSFYDIDQGAVPDFTISKYMSFYDRERLTEYIDSLL